MMDDIGDSDRELAYEEPIMIAGTSLVGLTTIRTEPDRPAGIRSRPEAWRSAILTGTANPTSR